jgi:hypothetical protein
MASDAHHGAEIHQRLVEVEDVAGGDECLRQNPQVFLHRMALRVALRHENPEQHARDVGVENGCALPEREAADGPCGIGADAFER